jgi:hypothetical protein
MVFFFFSFLFFFIGAHGPRTVVLSLIASVHGHILLKPNLNYNFILHFTAYDHQTGTLDVIFTNYFSLSTAHIILDLLMMKSSGGEIISLLGHHLFI